MKQWPTIADRWLASKTVAGVHVRWVNAQECIFTLCVLKQERQVLTVVTKQANIISIEELTEYLDPKVPVYLTIEGKGVLVCKVAEETDDFLRDIIPDARPEDFYTTQHAHRFVSIIRRSVVDELLETFTQAGRFVLAVHTGPFALNNLVPFLSEAVSSLSVSGQQFKMLDQRISGIISLLDNEEPEARYTVGKEKLATRYLLAYGTALYHFVPVASVLPQAEAQREFRHRQLFTKGVPVLLGFFLLILLINTAVYLPAFQRHQDLRSQTSADRVVLSQLETLQQEVTTQEQFLATLGWQRGSSKAATADRLAATVPGKIVLTELQVSPRDEDQYKRGKKQVFRGAEVYVSGRCSDMIVLNRWLSQLETLDWVDQLTDQQYTTDTEQRFGDFSFTLTLAP